MASFFSAPYNSAVPPQPPYATAAAVLCFFPAQPSLFAPVNLCFATSAISAPIVPQHPPLLMMPPPQPRNVTDASMGVAEPQSKKNHHQRHHQKKSKKGQCSDRSAPEVPAVLPPPPMPPGTMVTLPFPLPSEFQHLPGGRPPAPPTVSSAMAERFKTSLCASFMEKGRCKYNYHCMFAHGEAQLRTVEMNLEDGLINEQRVAKYRRDQRLYAKRAAQRGGIPFVPFTNHAIDPRLRGTSWEGSRPCRDGHDNDDDDDDCGDDSHSGEMSSNSMERLGANFAAAATRTSANNACSHHHHHADHNNTRNTTNTIRSNTDTDAHYHYGGGGDANNWSNAAAMATDAFGRYDCADVDEYDDGYATSDSQQHRQQYDGTVMQQCHNAGNGGEVVTSNPHDRLNAAGIAAPLLQQQKPAYYRHNPYAYTPISFGGSGAASVAVRRDGRKSSLGASSGASGSVSTVAAIAWAQRSAHLSTTSASAVAVREKTAVTMHSNHHAFSPSSSTPVSPTHSRQQPQMRFGDCSGMSHANGHSSSTVSAFHH